MDFNIRRMMLSDMTMFPEEFALQGMDKPVKLFGKYYEEQENGAREVFVATVDNRVAGYVTVLPHDNEGPFRESDIPVVADLNVLEKYQRMGIGNAMMDCVEDRVREYSTWICLGVGLHYRYGAAHRLFVKRGYIPDGSGVWFNGQRWEPNTPCVNDDSLLLYFSKLIR